MAKIVETVYGSIKPEEMGFTLMHEHIALAGLRDNYEGLLQEMKDCKAAGVDTIVDAGPINGQRMPEFIHKLCDEAGIKAMLTTGYMPFNINNRKDNPEYHTKNLANASVEELYELIMYDIENGVDGSGIYPGQLKWSTSLNKIEDFEYRSFEAVVRAQKKTGMAIFTHNTQGTMALTQAKMFLKADVDPSRVCIGHMDIPCCLDVMEEVLGYGFYIDFEHVGRFYPDDKDEAKRIYMIKHMIDQGYLDRILITGDMGKNRYLRCYDGNPGMDYIPKTFVPLLLENGVTQEQIDTIFKTNPANFFAYEK